MPKKTAQTNARKLRSNKPGEGTTFIDLFAGIGGFHQAFHNLGSRCVFASEWNDAARLTYRLNFQKTSPNLFENDDRYFNKDIAEITRSHRRRTKTEMISAIQSSIPPFDVLCAGFPCQPFSQAGHKLGFEDERGNLFFDIEKILVARQPEAIFLENVRHLQSHVGPDGIRTMDEIKERLKKAGYGDVSVYPVKASDHGLPQHRPRVFIIGFRDVLARKAFIKPDKRELQMTMGDVFDGARVTNRDGSERKVGYTLRVGGKSSPIDDRRNWDGYIVDGKVKRLMPHHGVRMQGFNPDFRFPPEVSHSDQMKQLGNSVAVPAIEDYGRAIFEALRHASR